MVGGMTTETKSRRCPRCKLSKPRADYHNRTDAKDGLSPYCKLCQCAYMKAYRKLHGERMNQLTRNWVKKQKMKKEILNDVSKTVFGNS
jgi:hypothetical protein